MTFTILAVLTGLIYIGILELSKNMLIGWAVAILAVVCMVLGRLFLSKNKKNNTGTTLLMWCAFILVLVLNLKFTAPPVKRVPAVDNRNPDVTEVVSIDQGDLTGVYNKDHSVKVFAGIPYQYVVIDCI